MRPWPAGASPSPAPPASSAPRSIERLLRSVPDCEVALLVRPGRRGAGRPGPARDPAQQLLRPPARRARRPASTPRWTAGSWSWPATSGVDGLGLDAAGEALLAACATVIHSAATVSFDSPLDAAVEINLLGPSRVADHPAPTARTAASRRPAAPPPDRRVHRLRGRQPARAGPRGHPARHARGRPRWRGARRSPRPAGPGPTPTPTSREPEDAAARFRRQARAELGAAGTPAAGRQVRTAPGGLGQGPHGRRSARPGPRASAGPTPTPTPRRSASGPCSTPAATCPSPSCGRRSSSRPWPSRSRAGSGASAWPTR